MCQVWRGSFYAIKRTHRMHVKPSWALEVERGRTPGKESREKRAARGPAPLPLVLGCNSSPAVPPSGRLGRFPQAQRHCSGCLASGAEVTLLFKEVTHPSRCHRSCSGMNRSISLIGQAPYGAFLAPSRLLDDYKLSEPCFYFSFPSRPYHFSF